MAKYEVINGMFKGLKFNGSPIVINEEPRIWNDDSTGQAFPAENCKLVYPENYTVKVDKEYQKTYETASWYKTVMIKAGDYPIEYVDMGFKKCSPEKSYYGCVKLTGEVTDSLFVSTLFTSSKVDRGSHVGEVETVFLQIYRYNLEGKDTFPEES